MTASQLNGGSSQEEYVEEEENKFKKPSYRGIASFSVSHEKKKKCEMQENIEAGGVITSKNRTGRRMLPKESSSLEGGEDGRKRKYKGIWGGGG